MTFNIGEEEYENDVLYKKSTKNLWVGKKPKKRKLKKMGNDVLCRRGRVRTWCTVQKNTKI